MKQLLILSALCSLLSAPALAQTKNVTKTISTNGLVENLVVPSGKTLTINAGGSIVNNGTATGFTASAVWGNITGTLSSQTDLQTALDDKASLTGTYSDPAWLTGLAWSKLGSVPAAVTALGTAGLGTGVLTGDGTAYSYLGITTNPRDNADAGKLVKTDVVGNISARTIVSQSDDLLNSVFLSGGFISMTNQNGGWLIQPSASSGLFTLSLPGETGTLLTDVSALSLGKLESAGATDTQVLTWSDANSQWEPATVLNLIADGSIAISKLAITGTPDGTKFLRDDGSWQTVTSGATLGANTFTGLQQFSGTTHAGLRLNNLTTAQRDAIGSPAAGMVIWNTTAARIQAYNGSAWTAGMVRLDGDTMTGALSINSVTLDGVSSGTLQLGTNHATSPTAQVVKAHNVTTGTGAALTLAGGTGSVAGGSVSLATSTTNGAPVARVVALASGDVTIGSTAAGYLHISSNTITGGFGGSTTSRPILRMAAGAGSSIHAVVAGISGNDFFGVTTPSAAANTRIFGVYGSNTSFTTTFGSAPKDSTGVYTGAGHTTAVVGGQGSSVTTGGAGGALTLTGGAAAGSGNNNGGNVTLEGGAPTGTGTRGAIILSNLPTSSAGLPSGALWDDAGTIKRVP